MVEYFEELHPITKGGLLCTILSLLFFALAFRGVNIGQVISITGKASQSAKWQNRILKYIGIFAIGGILISILGYSLPPWESNKNRIIKRIWYGTWNISFQASPEMPSILQNAETIRFYQYINKGEQIFEAEIKDSEKKTIGSFQRLESSLGNSDFRVISGQCQTNGGKSILVELALHGSQDLFSGVVFESKSANKYTCWGKKR